MTQFRVRQTVSDPETGKVGRVVFISPVTGQIYVEYGRDASSWIMYPPEQLSSNLFAPVS